MKIRSTVLAVAIGVIVWSGCGAKQACVPGAQVSCACPGGALGAQACTADGVAYGSCLCPTTGGGAGTGGGEATGGGGGGGGGGAVDAGTAVTVQDIAMGTIGPNVDVSLSGVVAMSQKFLYSRSQASGSCVWAVFVSAPGLSATAEYTGLLITSFGNPAITPPGGGASYCPRLGLGLEATGDVIPDSVKPGDVLTFTGQTQSFAPNCIGGAPAPQRSLRAVTGVKTGTSSVPTPHVASVAEQGQLAALGDATFHDKWGGVKVALRGVSLQADAGVFVDSLGVMTLAGSGLKVGEKVYYRSYQRASNACYAPPVFTQPTTFSQVEGFSLLDFCTWSLEVNDKCGDLTPFSTDCLSSTACRQ